MFTVLIETLDDEAVLAPTLAALVPAAIEGAVREVVVIDRGSKDGTLTIADAAGCTVVHAAKDLAAARRRAAERARGEWLLLVPPPMVMRSNWQADAMAFVDDAMVEGRGMRAVGHIRRGRVISGWRAALQDIGGWLRGRPPSRGTLVQKTAWLAANAATSLASAASLASDARRGAA